MDIERAWDHIGEAPDKDLVGLLDKLTIAKMSSTNPLQKIRQYLLINIGWGALICLLYVFILFYFKIWLVQLAIAIVLIFSLSALYISYLRYRGMGTSVSTPASLLNELKRNYRLINEWITAMLRLAIFFYPVSAAGGFILGAALGSGKPVAVFMGKPLVLISMLITIAILVPACHYLAKWMFNNSFGKHLKALKENIDALESEA